MQGAVLLIGVIFIVINLVVDVIYAYLDPRITYTKEEGVIRMAAASVNLDERRAGAPEGPDGAPQAPAAEKTESLWKDVWYALSQNIPAMVSLVIIAALALVAIVTFIAPGILPYDPYQQDLSASFEDRASRIGSGPTSRGAISSAACSSAARSRSRSACSPWRSRSSSA